MVTKFLRERQRYEIEVEEKRKEVPTMSLASYKVSIELSLLSTMFNLGEFDDIAPTVEDVTDLTSEHIKEFIKSLVIEETTDFDPHVIEEALVNLKVPMRITNAEARMRQFVAEFFRRLESVGCASIQKSNPKKTIKLIQERLYPKRLRDEMDLKLEYNTLLKSDLKAYMKVLRKEAVVVDRFAKIDTSTRDKAVRGHHNGGRKSGNNQKEPTGQHKKIGDTEGSASGTAGQEGKASKQLPVCLWPPCAKLGLRHFVSTCDKCPKDKVAELLEERRKKRGGKSAAIRESEGSQRDGDVENTSTLVRTTFNAAVTRVLCTDIGSDINLMPPELCEEISEKDKELQILHFKTPRKFRLAASEDANDQPIFLYATAN